MHEAQSAASLSHKNLISAIDVGFSNGYYYFVMEFVTGKSCRELLTAKGPFSEDQAFQVAAQTSAGWGNWSAMSPTVDTMSTTKPTAPQNVTGTPGNGKVSLFVYRSPHK